MSCHRESSTDLRSRAEEEFARRRPEGVPPDADVHKLLHELQVRQIELEMQNEALQEAQLELTQYRDHLEQLVSERTEKLRAANENLESFVYAASHDIAGPLGRINSFGTLLEKNCGDRLDDEGRFFLDIVRQNTTRLLTLLRDLLQHVQIGPEAPSLQPIGLRAFMAGMVQEFDGEIRDAGARVGIELPEAKVLANPERLAQVVRNLLQNALKFSARSQPPTIDIGGLMEGGDCRFWIRDNGIGFAMEYHDTIFGIFRRLHTYDEFPGTGIGLSLVKRAMELMGGDVWAESAPG
ncbi:MAG TPA: ATP-binding protein, partial [Rhodocyclaceae bacterium]|nr:ATP-binding protein [Rhodocyclaceae bacterium]